VDGILGELDCKQFKLMGELHRHISDILAMMADIDAAAEPRLRRHQEYGVICSPSFTVISSSGSDFFDVAGRPHIGANAARRIATRRRTFGSRRQPIRVPGVAGVASGPADVRLWSWCSGDKCGGTGTVASRRPSRHMTYGRRGSRGQHAAADDIRRPPRHRRALRRVRVDVRPTAPSRLARHLCAGRSTSTAGADPGGDRAACGQVGLQRRPKPNR
jgi:hypothetical protein